MNEPRFVVISDDNERCKWAIYSNGDFEWESKVETETLKIR